MWQVAKCLCVLLVLTGNIWGSEVRTSQLTLTFRPSQQRLVVKVYRPREVQESVTACPVVIFSHGLGGSQEDCGYLGAAWASRGIVSMHIRHEEISESCRDLRTRPLPAYREAYDRYWHARTVVRDIKCVLDWLTRDRAAGEQTPSELLGIQLDTTRIGVGGYNLGALASLMLGGQLPPDGSFPTTDSRICGVVSLGAPVYPTRTAPNKMYRSLDVPVLFVAGTEDDSVVGETKAPQRRLPFDLSTDADKYLLMLRGGDHHVYSGNRKMGRGDNDPAYHRAIARATVLFWMTVLESDQAAAAALAEAAYRRSFMAIGRLESKAASQLDQAASF